MTITNAEQVRAIVEPSAQAAANAAIREFMQNNPHLGRPAQIPETPAYVKWGSGVAATIVAAAILWMATTLNDLQITVARIDERQQQDTSRADIQDLQKRVGVLEQASAQR